MGPSPHHTPQGRATQSFPPERSKGPSQVTQYLLAEVVGSCPEYVLAGGELSLKGGKQEYWDPHPSLWDGGCHQLCPLSPPPG